MREPQPELAASSNSNSLSSNAKKAAENAGLSRPFSPMSSNRDMQLCEVKIKTFSHNRKEQRFRNSLNQNCAFSKVKCRPRNVHHSLKRSLFNGTQVCFFQAVALRLPTDYICKQYL